MTAAMADGSLPVSIVTALYLRTRNLHLEAERSGIIRELLRGNASRNGYILLLRNLLPACRRDALSLVRHLSFLAKKVTNLKFTSLRAARKQFEIRL